MKQDLASGSESGALTPNVPWDIGARTQRWRILDAMAKSSAEKTFPATTIADIVGHASISRATFYKHFANKEECFYAAVDAFLEELEAVANATYETSKGPYPDAVREIITAVMEHFVAKPHHAKLLLVEATVVDPEIVQRYRELVLGALKAHQEGTGKGLDGAGTDPEIAFGRAMVLVGGVLAAGQAEELESLLPELVYITLLPYVGQVEALTQAQLSR